MECTATFSLHTCVVLNYACIWILKVLEESNIHFNCLELGSSWYKDRILTAVHLRLGEYWRSLDTRSTASGGMRLWNICTQRCDGMKIARKVIRVKEQLSARNLETHFVPRVSLDLWEFEFCIIRVHAFDFLTSWGAKYLYTEQKILIQLKWQKLIDQYIELIKWQIYLSSLRKAKKKLHLNNLN